MAYKKMNVILRTSNDATFRLQVSARDGNAGMHFLSELVITEQWLSLFCGENDVQVDLCKRLRYITSNSVFGQMEVSR